MVAWQLRARLVEVHGPLATCGRARPASAAWAQASRRRGRPVRCPGGGCRTSGAGHTCGPQPYLVLVALSEVFSALAHDRAGNGRAVRMEEAVLYGKGHALHRTALCGRAVFAGPGEHCGGHEYLMLCQKRMQRRCGHVVDAAGFVGRLRLQAKCCRGRRRFIDIEGLSFPGGRHMPGGGTGSACGPDLVAARARRAEDADRVVVRAAMGGRGGRTAPLVPVAASWPLLGDPCHRRAGRRRAARKAGRRACRSWRNGGMARGRTIRPDSLTAGSRCPSRRTLGASCNGRCRGKR